MIYTSIKQLKQAAKLKFGDLSISQKREISKGTCTEIACCCKFGWTAGSLWETKIGLVYCNGYNEYCDMLSIKHNLEVR